MPVITDRQEEVYSAYLENNKHTTKTAEALDVPQPTVSYHVSTVEDKIMKMARFTQRMSEIEEEHNEVENLTVRTDWI